MSDRYLLESGAPDGYLLEDGSGVLLDETQATAAAAEVASGTGSAEDAMVNWQNGQGVSRASSPMLG